MNWEMIYRYIDNARSKAISLETELGIKFEFNSKEITNFKIIKDGVVIENIVISDEHNPPHKYLSEFYTDICEDADPLELTAIASIYIECCLDQKFMSDFKDGIDDEYLDEDEITDEFEILLDEQIGSRAMNEIKQMKRELTINKVL